MRVLIMVLAVSAAIVMAVDIRGDYDKAVMSTAFIQAGEGTGSGVFVGDHLVLTAFHVVEGEPVIRAHSPIRQDGAVVSDPARYTRGMGCVIVASDPAKDLALLRVEGTATPIPLARGEPSPGNRLFAIGCGDGTSLFGFSTGHVRQVGQAEYPRPDGLFRGRVIDMSVPVNMGDSGGPVIDSRGDLAGMVSGINAFKNQTYLAVTASEIRAFLVGVNK